MRLRRCGLLPPGKLWSPSTDSVKSPREWVATAHPSGKLVPQTADKPKETEPNTCSTKSSSSAASDRTQKPKPLRTTEYVVLNIATQENWKNDKGDYQTRTEWHRVYAWSNLSKFAKTLQKGQLVTLEGTLRYREVEDEVEATRFKHRIAEVHAIRVKRLSKIETADNPADTDLAQDSLSSERTDAWHIW